MSLYLVLTLKTKGILIRMVFESHAYQFAYSKRSEFERKDKMDLFCPIFIQIQISFQGPKLLKLVLFII